MSPPTTTIEMTRTGHSSGSPLIIRQPVTLEPLEMAEGGRSRPPFGALTVAAQGHLVAMIGEYLGTMMFLFFGFVAAQTGNEKADITLQASLNFTNPPPGPSLIQIAYISSVFGLSLATNVFVWYRVSGGMFNPSISFGLWLAGAFNWVRLVCVIPAQVLGSITAAGLVSVILPGPLQAENSLGPGVSHGRGFAMEMMLTAMLMIAILMLAVEKHRATFMAPLLIGIALLIIHLVGINVSGASINPARTLGPAFVNGSYVPEIWIYIVGPTLGAALAAGVHRLLTALAYQRANPGQDGDGMEYYRVVPPRASSSDSSDFKSSSFAGSFPQAAVTRVPGGGATISRRVSGKEDDEITLIHQGHGDDEYFGGAGRRHRDFV
ncbi:unnamed protein product [Discula destructiva]